MTPLPATPGANKLLSPNQQTFLTNAARVTKLDPNVLGGWLRNEEPRTDQNTDPIGHGRYNFLNVGITDSKPYGAASPFWNDPAAAGAATGNWLLGRLAIPGFGKSSSGIQALGRVAGQSPQAQIRAIQQSGWASGGETALPGLYRQIVGAGGIQPGNAPTPVTPAVAPRTEPAVSPGPVPQPSAPKMPNFAPLQAGFALSQQSNQRALDALGAISGQQRTAPQAPDFSALTQAQQSQLQPTQVPLQPTHVTVPLKGATPPGLDPQATKAVELARHYIGTPYHFGGASPGAGFDCSGLIQYTMGQLGIKIPRTAAEQYKTGTPVQTNQLQAGDALYFSSGSGVTHTGMYVGNGQFIEAPHTGDVVKIVPLAGAYQQQLVGARRFTKSTTAPTAPTAPTTPTQPAAPPRTGGGYTVGNFEGTQVASWMVPALQYARANGWKGTLTSGLRSTELQKQLYARYQAGGNIAAKPGQSNHEIQNGGAFDATDPETLHKILQAYKGQRPIWAMSVGLQDHPHFSLNGH